MSRSKAYDEWNERRRTEWPDAHHSAWSSEQVMGNRGHVLVAEWRNGYTWVLEEQDDACG